MGEGTPDLRWCHLQAGHQVALGRRRSCQASGPTRLLGFGYLFSRSALSILLLAGVREKSQASRDREPLGAKATVGAESFWPIPSIYLFVLPKKRGSRGRAGRGGLPWPLSLCRSPSRSSFWSAPACERDTRSTQRRTETLSCRLSLCRRPGHTRPQGPPLARWQPARPPRCSIPLPGRGPKSLLLLTIVPLPFALA